MALFGMAESLYDIPKEVPTDVESFFFELLPDFASLIFIRECIPCHVVDGIKNDLAQSGKQILEVGFSRLLQADELDVPSCEFRYR